MRENVISAGEMSIKRVDIPFTNFAGAPEPETHALADENAHTSANYDANLKSLGDVNISH